MIKNVTKIASATLIAGMVLAGVTACSGNTAPAPEKTTATVQPTEAAEPAEVIAPTILDVATIGGTTVELTLPEDGNNQDNVVIINSADPTVWTGMVDPADVAYYVAGGQADGVTYNMAITGNQAGKGTVTLTNSATGETVTFTVVVK